MIFYISVVLAVTSLLSFLILLICALFFFFFSLMYLAKGLSILFIFKEPALGITDFFYFFLYPVSFISVLIFVISFFLRILGFVCSFCSSFRCMDRLFV